jgi:hypothetical protein
VDPNSLGGQGSGGSDAAGTGGVDKLPPGGAASLPPCDGIPPYGMARENAYCVVPGQRCLCPDDRRPLECRDIATCGANDQWEVERSDCPPPEREGCPQDPLAVCEMLCAAEGLRCPLADPNLACHCVNAGSVERYGNESCSGYLPIWYCGETDSGCPLGVPEVGSACGDEGLRCGNGCFNRMARECVGGVWIEGQPHGECV